MAGLEAASHYSNQLRTIASTHFSSCFRSREVVSTTAAKAPRLDGPVLEAPELRGKGFFSAEVTMQTFHLCCLCVGRVQIQMLCDLLKLLKYHMPQVAA